ncbi:hypothetical protein NDU88_006540 [Pleurodeles waltl]|uniref:Uncharacterized protein n=1 Tax=Pleurodeles waltl TaxID=8319 RepID=A0AAV7WGN9_PLEWA|nr:hypothetical protein NDU88_006540 [Pleurodeles waltl]
MEGSIGMVSRLEGKNGETVGFKAGMEESGPRQGQLNGHPAPTSNSLQLPVVPRCTAFLGSPLPSPRQRGTVCKKRRAEPARLRPSPPRNNVGKSGSGWRRDCILEAKATYAEAERLDSPLPPRKPHLDGPLQQESARKAAGKVAPQGGPGGRGALITATAKRLPGPQAHTVRTRGTNPTEPQSASQGAGLALTPRKPHPVGLLSRGSTSRQADKKRQVKAREKPLNWTAVRGALVAATGGRITFRQEQQAMRCNTMRRAAGRFSALPVGSRPCLRSSRSSPLLAHSCSAVSHPALLTSNVPAEQNFRRKNASVLCNLLGKVQQQSF